MLFKELTQFSLDTQCDKYILYISLPSMVLNCFTLHFTISILFLLEGCCDHLVHLGDEEGRGEGGTSGPIYELVLLCQTFILFLCTFVFYVLVSLGFIYGAHLSVYTIWPI